MDPDQLQPDSRDQIQQDQEESEAVVPPEKRGVTTSKDRQNDNDTPDS